MTMDAGAAGPPLHVHPTHGGGFYVLAGTLTFQVGDRVVTGGPGTWVFAPRHAPHTLANHSAEMARVLCVFAPAGFERRFERMLGEAGTEEQSEAERATRLLGPPIPAPGRLRRVTRALTFFHCRRAAYRSRPSSSCPTTTNREPGLHWRQRCSPDGQPAARSYWLADEITDANRQWVRTHPSGDGLAAPHRPVRRP